MNHARVTPYYVLLASGRRLRPTVRLVILLSIFSLHWLYLTGDSTAEDLTPRPSSLPPAIPLATVKPIAIFGPEPRLSRLLRGDFNGDGKADLVAQKDKELFLTLALGGDNFSFEVQSWKVPPFSLQWDRVVVLDVNGDGISDIVGPEENWNRWVVISPQENGRFSVSISEVDFPKDFAGGFVGTNLRPLPHWQPLINVWEQSKRENARVFQFLFTGSRIVQVDPGDNPHFYSSRLIPFGCVQKPETGACEELVALRQNWQKPNVEAVVGYADSSAASFPPAASGLWRVEGFGDFNGDKKLDILGNHPDYYRWWISYSGPEYPLERPVPGVPAQVSNAPQILIGDFNGDSLDEIIAANPGTGSYTLVTPDRFEVPLSSPGPKMCVGFLPGNKYGRWGRTRDRCPKGYAVLETGIMRTRGKTIDAVSLPSTCCPLPSSDILTDEETETDSQCPSGFLAIGKIWDPNCSECSAKLSCRKVNSSRYQLGVAEKGQYWGFRRYLYDGPGLEKSEIPLALRAGFGRVTFNTWAHDGCLGKTVGAALTGIGERCPNMSFAEIQYSGAAGDPPKGTPVKMFPDCRKQGNIFDPLSSCKE